MVDALIPLYAGWHGLSCATKQVDATNQPLRQEEHHQDEEKTEYDKMRLSHSVGKYLRQCNEKDASDYGPEERPGAPTTTERSASNVHAALNTVESARRKGGRMRTGHQQGPRVQR